MVRTVTATLCFVLFTDSAASAETKTYPLTTLEGTTNKEVVATPVVYKGQEGLHVTVSPEHKSIQEGGCDNCTFVALDGIDFANGTIEIEVAEWTSMRIDVDGEKLRLYLNGAEMAALVVADLKLGADQHGTIGLFTESATDAYFRNLVVTPRQAGFMAR